MNRIAEDCKRQAGVISYSTGYLVRMDVKRSLENAAREIERLEGELRRNTDESR